MKDENPLTYPSDEYLKRLGMVTISFSDLESSLGTLLESVIDSPKNIAPIFSSQLSFKRMLDVIHATYKHRWPLCSRLADLQNIIKRCQIVEEKRNALVHSSYGFPNEISDDVLPRYKFAVRRKTGLRHTTEELSISELDKIIDQLVEAVTDVWQFSIWIVKGRNQSEK